MIATPVRGSRPSDTLTNTHLFADGNLSSTSCTLASSQEAQRHADTERFTHGLYAAPADGTADIAIAFKAEKAIHPNGESASSIYHVHLFNTLRIQRGNEEDFYIVQAQILTLSRTRSCVCTEKRTRLYQDRRPGAACSPRLG